MKYSFKLFICACISIEIICLADEKNACYYKPYVKYIQKKYMQKRGHDGEFKRISQRAQAYGNVLFGDYQQSRGIC